MFQMMRAGNKAGSGIDKIQQVWATQKWHWSLIEEQSKPDRVRLILPMVSLLPENSLTRLRSALGDNLSGLNGREVQALVTADVEGSVTNQRLQQFSNDHTTDITRMLQDLMSKGFLIKDGYGRWASYRLAKQLGRSGNNAEGTPDITAEDSGHKKPTPDTRGQLATGVPEEDPNLLAIAKPAREQERLDPSEMRRLIRTLCKHRDLTFRQLATLLNREAVGLQRWHLRPMVQDGQLVMQFPDNPNHPKQAYRTHPDWRES